MKFDIHYVKLHISSAPLLKQKRCLVCYIRNQCYVSCALDSDSKLSLMLCAGSGDSAGKNLCSFGKILSESGNIFVIYIGDLLGAERANLLPLVRTERLLLCILRIFVLYIFIQSDNLLY